MNQSTRCYSMAERRAAGFATHTPLDQYPETIFEREERRRDRLALLAWALFSVAAALALAWAIEQAVKWVMA